MVVKGVMVGIRGGLHADPAAGVSTGSGSGTQPAAGLGQTAGECFNWGVNTLAAGSSSSSSSSSAAVRSDPLVIESAMFEQLPADTPLPLSAFRLWCRHLSATMPSDDAFSRALDTVIHTGLVPVVTAAVQHQRTEGVTVPDRARGEKTAYAEVGSGLAFAAMPYDPHLKPTPAARPPPPTDPDAAFSQGTVPAIAVLVTHEDGRKTMQRVRVNRYTAGEQQEALLQALRMAGVGDAVKAEVDF